MNVHLRLFPILLVCAGLAGCVTFERVPAPLTCDTRLVGRWLPMANSEEEKATLTKDDYVQVDPQCKAMFSFSQTSSRPLTTLQVDARGFTLEGQHYLALSEADVARLLAQGMSIDGQPPREPADHTPTEAVTLLRYRIEEDVFSYAMIDYAMVEKLVKEKSLDADALDQVSINLKCDDEHLLGILRQYPELFKQDPKMTMTLRRAPVEAGP